MSIVALPVQLQNFSLSGSGSSIGDTVLNLKSFKDINGVNLAMSSFGSIGYGTIEPGNGTQEEQISFSGITQNSDGTAQLTGVKHVLFKSPFTETSGMTITHPGAVIFVITNTSGFENAIYTYINNAIASGGVPATQAQQGITTLSVDPVVLGSPIAVGDNDPRVPTQAEKNYLASVRTIGIPYALATGTASAFTATLASSFSVLASGAALDFRVPTTNATGVTLNVNSLGAVAIKKNFNVALASGDLVTGQIAQVVYDPNSSAFQLTSPVAATSPYNFANGSFNKDISSTTSTTIAHGLGVIPKRVAVSFAASPQSNVESFGSAVYIGTTQTSQSTVVLASTSLSSSSAFRIWYDVSQYIAGTITTDATNITIAWSKTGTPTGTIAVNWEAMG